MGLLILTKDESVLIFFAFFLTPNIEIEIKGGQESCNFEEIHDKKDFELVIKRVANTSCQSCVDNGCQNSRTSGRRQHTRRNGKKSFAQ